MNPFFTTINDIELCRRLASLATWDQNLFLNVGAPHISRKRDDYFFFYLRLTMTVVIVAYDDGRLRFLLITNMGNKDVQLETYR